MIELTTCTKAKWFTYTYGIYYLSQGYPKLTTQAAIGKEISIERTMVAVEFTWFSLLIKTYTLDELSSLVISKEFEYAIITPQRIIESAEANEIIVMFFTLHCLLEQHYLALQLTVAAPHDIDALPCKVHIRQLIYATEQREVALSINMKKEAGARRKTLDKSS